MKGWLALVRRHGRLHLWLASQLLILGAYLVCRGDKAWMDAFTGRVTRPLQATVGRLCYKTSLSVMEIGAALLTLFAVLWLVWCLIAFLADRGRRLERLYTNVLATLCIVLTFAAASCLMWGAQFGASGFQDLSGLYGEPVSTEDLRAVTAWFADRASETADTVARDGGGRFAVPRKDILTKAPEIYDGAEALYPFLTFEDTGVKAMTFSRVMSILDFTGFYCAFTGEANVNTDSPACLLPSTAAHEMAHQRGIASEQECNFLAVLACVTSGDPAYTYSGHLMGYIYLGNALYRADAEAYREIREGLSESVKADLAENNAYWEQFRDTLPQRASNTVYDGILKGYGDERGMQSYGAMVDLLVAYWGSAAEGTTPPEETVSTEETPSETPQDDAEGSDLPG